MFLLPNIFQRYHPNRSFAKKKKLFAFHSHIYVQNHISSDENESNINKKIQIQLF